MLNLTLQNVVQKLNPLLRNALEEAAALAMSQGHYNVEIEHWMQKILELPHTDLLSLLRANDINADRLIQQAAEAVNNFRSGNTRAPALSPGLVTMASQAWMLASVEFGHKQVTSGHLITAALLDENLSMQLTGTMPELSSLSGEKASASLLNIVGKTTESALLDTDQSAPGGAGGVQGGRPGEQSTSLKKYTLNMTERASQGEIDPVLGRDTEVRQLIDILLRRRQNNPILTGEPGVGKTAVVEGFALRLASGDVPEPLQGIQLLSLDLGLLQAGASVKGEFEKRLKAVIQEVKESPEPTIVFIDEAHTLIGAGGAEGKGDAANLLKPALARGEFRTIAATTWSEYKKYFEKDPALTRRFQVVNVAEPDVVSAIDMMRGIAGTLSDHHKVRILDEAVEACVKLSARYIPARQLPDKAVSLLDTACARVALSQGAVPAALERARRDIEQCDTNIALLEDEQKLVGGCEEKLAQYREQKIQAEQTRDELEARWAEEKELIAAITSARAEGKGPQELAEKVEQLQALQGQNPLVALDVDSQAVAEVVENWTGIPVGRMVADEIQTVNELDKHLADRVVGQDHAMAEIAQAIRTSRAGLMDPRKPVGVFLLVGTSGTGKTETALALADKLYGGEQNLVTINMSEFKEEHKISMLLGASAGYVGYGEGGILTEAVRRNPYSVVLLDEMEKAHPGIQDVFYNLFDKGTIKDGEGRDIDFRNTIIIMTSNACSGQIADICLSGDVPPAKELLETIRPELLEHFRPAFLGRTTIVPYFPLNREVLTEIVKINLAKIERRIKERYNAAFEYEQNLIDELTERCKDPDTGARNVENVISRSVLPALAGKCLEAMSKGVDIKSVKVSTDGSGGFVFDIG
ncbi:MAG: type VI secretion system ATPase TssH [Oceanospirillaceae bacterium]|uniref:type VI secretion system ATPase TssH n=1 Tax=Thalassolituus sp. UBA1505 TaxID=1947653 RepID=UPI000C585D25|nr:type VI secretion system ATPase TssH [Thalassolituus sp. UBA1505]MBS52561.1 type VI secretion system ATPase TssH [Oceanospirillaceae bacterium]